MSSGAFIVPAIMLVVLAVSIIGGAITDRMKR